jgi:hypothetical protein
MKRIIPSILIFFILYSVCGYHILFRVQLFTVHREMKQIIRRGIKDEELIILRVADNSTSAIQWIKRGKEFRLKGEMYDVVKALKKDHISILYCIMDSKEKQLIARYEKAHRHQKPEQKIRIIPGFGMYFQTLPFTGFILPEHDLVYYHACRLSELFSEIPFPPPKSA